MLCNPNYKYLRNEEFLTLLLPIIVNKNCIDFVIPWGKKAGW